VSDKLTTIKLAGELGRRFGKIHKLAVSSAAEAVRAMSVLFPGFQYHINTSKERGVGYAVFTGKNNIGKEELHNPVAGNIIKFVPIIQGSKSGGFLQILLGVVLIAASFGVAGIVSATVQGALFSTGVSMALGGVINLLSPQQNIQSKNNPSNGTSYNFSGPVNTSAQGNPVPVLYGRMIVGSAVISAGIMAEDQQ
jgi:predicted phage tail protein